MSQASTLKFARQEADGSIGQLLQSLRSRNADERTRAAQALAQHVALQARETSSESFSKFMDEVNARVMELVHSSSTQTHEKLGGIAAIEVLIDVEYAESAKQITRMANSLHPVMWSRDVAVSHHAVAVLGKLARSRGALLADLLESELKRALEWLEDHGGGAGILPATTSGSVSSGLSASGLSITTGGITSGSSRTSTLGSSSGGPSAAGSGHQNLAALLVLAELGRNAPSIFYPHVSLFLQLIWKGGLLDKDLATRTAACDALTSALSLLHKRETQHSQHVDGATKANMPSDGLAADSSAPNLQQQQHMSFYMQVYENAIRGLTGTKGVSVDILHGSLIALSSLLEFGPASFLAPRFKQTCDVVLKIWSNSNKLVKRTVIATLPALANATPADFAKFYLPTVMQLLLTALKKDAAEFRPALLLAVGRIAVASGGESMKGYLDSLVPLLKTALQAAATQAAAAASTASQSSSAQGSGSSGSGNLASGSREVGPSAAAASAAAAAAARSLTLDGLSPTPLAAAVALSDAAMQCIAQLAHAVGPALQPHIRGELLDLLFGGGISPILVETAAALAEAIPPLLIDIQIRLMDLISHLLAHKPFKFPGAPGWLTRQSAGSNLSDAKPTASLPPVSTVAGTLSSESVRGSTSSSSLLILGADAHQRYYRQQQLQLQLHHQQHEDPNLSMLLTMGGLMGPTPSTPGEHTAVVRLALRTLGGFNFHKAMLTEFLRKCVLLYLEDDNSLVRLEAVLTSSKLLVPHVAMAFNPSSSSSSSLIGLGPLQANEPNLAASLHLSGSTTSLTPPSASASSMGDGSEPSDGLAPSHSQLHAFRYAGLVVSQVLHRLLQVAVTDSEAYIRASVIQSLDPSFDPFLAQADNLRLLFMAVNDEVFEIRTGAIQVIGRLSQRNPAYVLPSLRRRLIQLLTELEYGSEVDSIAREQSALQLVLLINAAGGRVVSPYSRAVLSTLLRRVTDSDPRVAAHVIDAIGQLALVADLTPSFEQLMPIIMDTLQDNSSLMKRRAALRTLGHLIRSTGIVIKPLLKYPKLLDSLLAIIKTEQSPDLKFLVVKLMGIVGALDPEVQRQNQLRNQKKRKAPTPLMPLATAPSTGDTGSSEPLLPHSNASGETSTVSNQFEQPSIDTSADAQASDLAPPVTSAAGGPDDVPPPPPNANSPFNTADADDLGSSLGGTGFTGGMLNMSSEEYHPTVAVRALLRILKDPSLSAHHQNAVQAIMSMFKSLGLRCVSFLPQIMPPYLQLLRTSEPRFREFLFQQLAVLVSIVKIHLRDYLPQIFELVREYWCSPQSPVNLLLQLATLVEEISGALNDEFAAYMPQLMPLLLQVLHSEQHSVDRRRTYRLLKTLEQLGSLLDEYVHLVIPPLVNLVELDRSAATASSRSATASPGSSISTVHPLASVSLGSGSGASTSASAGNRPDLSTGSSSGASADGTVLVSIESMILSFAAMRCVSALATHMGLADWAARLVHPLLRLIDYCCSNALTAVPASFLIASIGGAGPSSPTSVPGGPPGAALASSATQGAVGPSSVQVGLAAAAMDSISDFGAGGLGSATAVTSTDLLQQAMSTLSLLVCQLRHDYIVFIPAVRKLLIRHHIIYPPYENLEAALLTNNMEHFGEEASALWSREDQQPSSSRAPDQAPLTKLKVNEQNLRRAWETSSRATKEDWTEWLRKFAIELLRESPSPALRSCLYVVDYAPLVRSLFNAGFVSCWRELSETYQRELIRHLETALLSPNIPQEILQNLLDLAEFMEHDEAPLPIEAQTLSVLADKCHAYAKALHYREIEFKKSSAAGSSLNTGIIEALISINNKLGQPHAAAGILRYAQQSHGVELKESWYEKLGRWEEALAAYSNVLASHPAATSATIPSQPTLNEAALGRLRSLHALGEWETLLHECVRETHGRSNFSDSITKAIAPLAATAAWYLQDWGTLAAFTANLNESEPDGAFFRAVLNLHQDNFERASKYINICRDLLDTELTALFGESYQRAYMGLIRAQQLSEMEEIIEFKQRDTDSDRRDALKAIWMHRLEGVQRDTDVWRRLLAVRAMVIPPSQDLDAWLQFASLARKCQRLRLSHRILLQLAGDSQQSSTAPKNLLGMSRVRFALIKQQWAEGNRDSALQQLRTFALQLLASGQASDPSYQRLLARVALTTGEWLKSSSGVSAADGPPPTELSDDSAVLQAQRAAILAEFKAATKYDPLWYKAWHALAMSNFELLSSYRTSSRGSGAPPSAAPGLSSQVAKAHLVPTVQGFFRSIALSPSQNLQDVLRLLTLWFDYGADKSVEAALAEGFGTLSIDVWLPVIPQIIARIHSPVASVRSLLQQLLIRIGKEHPQALVYPLTVASKSQSSQRLAAAKSVMDKMRQHSAILVDQALLVSRELIRVAILWPEMWYEGLEDASRLYFGERNVDGMLTTLAPLHKALEHGAETPSEASFQAAFGRELSEAHEWCKKYYLSRNDADINRAWDLYYHVFRRINKQLPLMTTLELKNVSPLLLASRQMELAVPGTYRAGKAVVRIHNFSPILKVITSKQRPRKLNIVGGDGLDYNFLLKGHEDLRQDERVMQLFELVNSLLRKQRYTAIQGASSQAYAATAGLVSAGDLSIQPYSVIPLSPNSGLIGWVAHCDTLHQLIREFRQSRNIPLNIEHRYMLRMASDFDNLSLIQKVEVFEYALESTNGMDLERVLWLKSPNSETWLERRTNYTVSLAVMSMVGYVLGLGDRHPSNLMLDRHTGKIIHIDFGDCFEVAMYREKYPEKIPFRLTRMLVNAMEVSGIEGNFRTTCEQVMGVLRANKDSLMAVLEAFVHDPLINWRLLNQPGASAPTASHMDAPESLQTTDAPESNPNAAGAPDAAGPGLVKQDISSRVLAVINRVSNKLTGRDFDRTIRQGPSGSTAVLPPTPGVAVATSRPLTVTEQVHRLILQATSVENLCQCYIGWCSFW